MGGLPESFEFLIVGDGPERPELEQLAKALGVETKVRFRGLIPYESVAAEIAKADVCICPLPDRLEWNVSSPLKVFEYMACAKPMILTPIPAHKDVLPASEFVVWTHGFESSDFAERFRSGSASRRASCGGCEGERTGQESVRVARSGARSLHRYVARHCRIRSGPGTKSDRHILKQLVDDLLG